MHVLEGLKKCEVKQKKKILLHKKLANSTLNHFRFNVQIHQKANFFVYTRLWTINWVFIIQIFELLCVRLSVSNISFKFRHGLRLLQIAYDNICNDLGHVVWWVRFCFFLHFLFFSNEETQIAFFDFINWFGRHVITRT